MLSKRDFNVLANMIKDDNVLPFVAQPVWKHFHITALADWLATTNPRFDRERFIAACSAKQGAAK